MTPMHRDPPLILKVGLALTLFNSWVLFEEIIIDRLGWWRYMPCYRVGRFCEWDAAAIPAILTITTLAFADSRARLLALLKNSCAHLGCKLCKAA
jgi:hypothetical protein